MSLTSEDTFFPGSTHDAYKYYKVYVTFGNATLQFVIPVSPLFGREEMIDFDEYFYYPTLMSRVAEIQGLRELSEDKKKRIVPLFTLGKWHNSPEFDRAIENCGAAIGPERPFFADLTREARHQPDTLSHLLDPDGDFEAWRDYIVRFDNAIPIVQMTANATRRQVTRQAQLLERTKGQIAFRVRNPRVELPMVINALSALDDTDNAIVFADVRYIRDEERAAEAVVADMIDRIRDEIPNIRVVVLSSSFPSYLGEYADDDGETRGSLEILERRLHASIVSNGRDCLYGDYASIHPIIRASGGGGAPIPRIDIATRFTWHFERRPTMKNIRPAAYSQIAAALIERIPDITDLNCWGTRMLIQAANGEPHGLAPAPWIAARVNMHLTQQIIYADETEVGDEIDDDL